MSALLVLTTGQTDVQLVEGQIRRALFNKVCASLHDEIERRRGDWQLTESPLAKQEDTHILPQGTFALCTPKLDAVLAYLAERNIKLTAALILETRRDTKMWPEEPRFVGSILTTRLRECGVADVRQVPFLTGCERQEDREHPRDTVIRREVVSQIDQAIRNTLAELKPMQVIVATTGGMKAIKSLVEEIVLLYAADSNVDLLEVSDGAKASPPAKDRAVSRRLIPEPEASYQARRHALELIGKGNLLGAWGAVQHLHEDEVEHHWTQVIQWLARFAASMPMPPECDILILAHPQNRAIQAALRVELALRAGDIPRAVHGTVAFFESALWDHLNSHLTLRENRNDPKKRKLYRADPDPADLADQAEKLVRRKNDDSKDHKPFTLIEKVDGIRWYEVNDSDACGCRLAKRYLNQASLHKLGTEVSKIRDLRNDVAHNEPTPKLMYEARSRMIEASLWSVKDTFLTQSLVQDVLRDLEEPNAEHIWDHLFAEIRTRLLGVSLL